MLNQKVCEVTNDYLFFFFTFFFFSFFLRFLVFELDRKVSVIQRGRVKS